MKQVLDNQALNTLFNYGTDASDYAVDLLQIAVESFPCHPDLSTTIRNHSASDLKEASDM